MQQLSDQIGGGSAKHCSKLEWNMTYMKGQEHLQIFGEYSGHGTLKCSAEKAALCRVQGAPAMAINRQVVFSSALKCNLGREDATPALLTWQVGRNSAA